MDALWQNASVTSLAFHLPEEIWLAMPTASVSVMSISLFSRNWWMYGPVTSFCSSLDGIGEIRHFEGIDSRIDWRFAAAMSFHDAIAIDRFVKVLIQVVIYTRRSDP
jgi:hypothetical protein